MQQRVQQCALPAVRRAHDGHRHSVAYCVPHAERVGEGSASRNRVVQQRGKPVPVGEFHFLLAEVELQLHQRRQLEQFRAYLSELLRISSAQLVHRHAVLHLRTRCDHIGHRLRLREVHLSVHERPAREFTRLRKAASCLRQQLQYASDYVCRRMAAQLH